MFVPIRHTVTALTAAVCFLFALIFSPIAPISMAFTLGGLICVGLVVFSAVRAGIGLWSRARAPIDAEVQPPRQLNSRT